jgi:hypothetical protein
LEGLHAEVTVAGVGPAGHPADASAAIAVAQERIQVLAALEVRLAVSQRSVARALIDGHHSAGTSVHYFIPAS